MGALILSRVQTERSRIGFLDLLLCVLAFMALMLLVVGAIYIWVEWLDVAPPSRHEESFNNVIGIFFAVQALAFVLAVEIGVLWRRRLSWWDLGWTATSVPWMFAAMAGAVTIVIFEMALSSHTLSSSDFGALSASNSDFFPRDPSLGVYLSLFIGISAATAIGEECFFRGVVFNVLRGRMRFLYASVGSSLVFAAIHVDYFTISTSVSVFAGSFLLVSGMLFAWLYEKSGSLVPPIICHGLINATALLNGYDNPLSLSAFV